MPVNSARRCVGGLPISSPSFVPDAVQPVTTLSPLPTMSSTMTWTSRIASRELRSRSDAGSWDVDGSELGDERIGVSGRWFGARGRRFARPSLTVSADGATRRSLAVLEHKPWAPSEGETWVAAFPWEAAAAADVVDAQLAVAPDIPRSLPA